jgi:prophage regulatory protein
MNYQLPETGFLNLAQIIGQEEVTEQQAAENRKRGKGPKRPRPGKPAIIPVKKSCWWEGVKIGRFPPAVKVGSGRGAFWKVESIRALIASA